MTRSRWSFVCAVALFVCAFPAIAQMYVFHLRGDQEVPPTASLDSGGCFGQLDQPGAKFSVTCVHDVSGASAAGIHEAPALENGPLVYTFASPASPLSGNVPMSPRLVADYAATFLYLEIHTPVGMEGMPSPQIRGQIGTPPAAP